MGPLVPRAKTWRTAFRARLAISRADFDRGARSDLLSSARAAPPAAHDTIADHNAGMDAGDRCPGRRAASRER